MSDGSGFDNGITRRQWLGRTAGVAAAAGMGSLLGGLPIGAARAQGQPKRGGTLRVATVDKPVNMDPGFAQLYSSLQIYQNVFNKLVYVDETGQFIPGLAKSWKQENDKTWLFDLVDNAVFHNGEPFTAKDVTFTFTRILDAKNKLPMRVFFTPVEGVEAVGSHQVRFHLNKPWGAMLATLAQATEMVNEKALQAKDPKLFPIGTGPYKFVEWVKDDHVTLERWDKYFRPSQPYIDRIIFNAPADDTVRLTGLQTGKFNWIQTVPPQRIPELERARDMKSSPGRPYFPFFFMLNASRPPLGDKRIRQAIAWALDRSEIVKLVYYGSHVVTAEPTPEPSPWATGVNAHKGGPDLARAKQLMSDAGRRQRPHPDLPGQVAGARAREDRGDPARAAQEDRHHARRAAARVRAILRGARRQEVRRGRGVVERQRRPGPLLLPACSTPARPGTSAASSRKRPTGASTPSARPRIRRPGRRCTPTWSAGSRRKARSSSSATRSSGTG